MAAYLKHESLKFKAREIRPGFALRHFGLAQGKNQLKSRNPSEILRMLILKRLMTGCCLFPVLFIVFFFGTCLVGGAVVGGLAGAHTTNYEEGRAAGQKAGQEFGRKYAALMMVGAGGVAGLIAIVVPICGILPWCKPERQDAYGDQGYPRA